MLDKYREKNNAHLIYIIKGNILYFFIFEVIQIDSNLIYVLLEIKIHNICKDYIKII